MSPSTSSTTTSSAPSRRSTGTIRCPTSPARLSAKALYVSKAADGTTMNAENNCTVRQETASGVYQLCKPGMDVYVPNLSYTDEELEEDLRVSVHHQGLCQRAAHQLHHRRRVRSGRFSEVHRQPEEQLQSGQDPRDRRHCLSAPVRCQVSWPYKLLKRLSAASRPSPL